MITVLAGLGGAVQAGLIVVPAGNANVFGHGSQSDVLGAGANPETFQWDYAASQFAGVPIGSLITGIGFRLPADTNSITSDYSIGSLLVQLSTSVNAIGSLSAVPANNLGPDVTTVFSGPLTIPANSLLEPNPIIPGTFYLISFTTPYVYKGGDLLVTVGTANEPTGLWVDANRYSDVSGIADSSCCGSAEFYNIHVTEYAFTPPTQSTAPEPGTLLLIGGGFAILALRKMRG